LRDGEGRRPVQPQFRLVDRGERGAERSDRQSGLQFDRIFQEMRGVVGGTARNGDDNGRVTGLQVSAGFPEVGIGIVQQAGDCIGNLIDFLAHQGCHRFMSLIKVCHSGPIVSSATRS
jgi:hypothetical protein